MWAIRYRDIEYPTDLEAEEDRHIDIGALPRGKGEGGGEEGSRMSEMMLSFVARQKG